MQIRWEATIQMAARWRELQRTNPSILVNASRCKIDAQMESTKTCIHRKTWGGRGRRVTEGGALGALMLGFRSTCKPG